FIKARYKNAIHYIDSLFGATLNHLKEKGLYDNSIIIFTGDHGEEFFEEGYFFHGSRLSRMQTQIPIYYKFTSQLPHEIQNKKFTSQMDIFPTIFHHILGKNDFNEVLEGNSLLDQSKWPFVITSRYNASRSPYEFFFHNGEKKLYLRLEDIKHITKSKRVQVLSLQDKNGNNTHFSTEEFHNAFQKIFPYFNSLKKEAASSSD
ncbi:MAG: sulfatase-like hydrolase/transferase, partial [Chlamydiota bacterium]